MEEKKKIDELIKCLQENEEKIIELINNSDLNQKKIVGALYVEFKDAIKNANDLFYILDAEKKEVNRLKTMYENKTENLNKDIENRVQMEISQFRRLDRKNNLVRTRMAFYIPIETKEKLRILSAGKTIQATLEKLILQMKDDDFAFTVPLADRYTAQKIRMVAWIDCNIGNYLRDWARKNDMKVSTCVEMLIEIEHRNVFSE